MLSTVLGGVRDSVMNQRGQVLELSISGESETENKNTNTIFSKEFHAKN